ncbi:Os06g0685250, partial [Oryza sativa Japonica Group]
MPRGRPTPKPRRPPTSPIPFPPAPANAAAPAAATAWETTRRRWVGGRPPPLPPQLPAADKVMAGRRGGELELLASSETSSETRREREPA